MKKIKEWFIGLVLAFIGGGICLSGVGAVLDFLNMLISNGKDFIWHFINFTTHLLILIFAPHILFTEVKEYINDIGGKHYDA